MHSQFGWPAGYGGVLAATVTGRPLVATMRGMDVLVDRELDYGLRIHCPYDRALRLLLRNANRTTHVSDFIRQKAVELGGRSSSAITIRKGVDCDHFKRRADLHGAKAKPMMLTVAGLIRRKGIDYILRALGLLVDSHNFDFVVVGCGPEMNNLQALCDELGLRSRTCFEGYVPRDQIAQFFSACDIFVLGSIWEASGNVLLEALASGCPVVCTASGGPPEYIVDGETGFVVPPRDPGAMADRIRVLLDDSELREKLGREARADTKQRFAHPRMIDNIIGVYRGVTAGQPIDKAGGSLGAQ